MSGRHSAISALVSVMTAAALLAGCDSAKQKAPPPKPGIEIPHVVHKNGRSALIVDGAPFTILGVQANNSSNYPSMLADVWAAAEKTEANTVAIPVAWEQIEPVEGKFDFTYVDTLIREARAHKMRLVLLWFATWKNTSPSYAPGWVKNDNARFPRMRDAKGNNHYALSPHARTTLEADKKAFVALMRYIRLIDDKRTVIMMQVENEPGTYRLVRDYGPEAQKLFDGPVPEKLVAKMGKQPGSWKQVFGKDADEYFHTWAVASYIQQVAAAGIKAYKLPMYANAALADPFKKPDATSYATGGPAWHVLDIWRAAAPDIFTAAPDMYSRDYKTAMAHFERYDRPDNPLLIVEIGNDAPFARFFYPVLGRHALGFTPFGIDFTGYFNYPLGAKKVDAALVEDFAQHYRRIKPMMREWAKFAFENETWGVAEPDDHAPHILDLGRWKATVSYRDWQFGERKYFPKADFPDFADRLDGGALIARLGADEFLVIAHNARVSFDLKDDKSGKHAMIDVVEEGHYDKGKWVVERVWNGDQTDYGLNFTHLPQVLRVKLSTY